MFFNGLDPITFFFFKIWIRANLNRTRHPALLSLMESWRVIGNEKFEDLSPMESFNTVVAKANDQYNWAIITGRQYIKVYVIFDNKKKRHYYYRCINFDLYYYKEQRFTVNSQKCSIRTSLELTLQNKK